MDWFTKHYIKHDSELRDPLASPQYADLRGMPYTILVSAELDPLREQEIDFAKRLEQSGVKVKLLDYPGMIHNFMVLPGYFGQARQAIKEVGKEIRKLYVENSK